MRRKNHMAPARIILIGFALLILAGALLLTLPISTRDGQGAAFFDALFTATSATCVTGLVVQDTALYWSGFGQAVILMLIQIGGMGVVTAAAAISMLAGRRIGLKERWVMQESISAPQVGGIVRRTRFILAVTLVLEGTGTLLLALRFCPEMGLFRGLWYAVFHAVSSFCNAGFDLMGAAGTPFVSLTGYAGDPLVNFTVMGLIVLGGIGFLTWGDVREHKWHLRAYCLQSKLVLAVTVALILLPALFFLLYELRLPQWQTLTLGEKVQGALFQAVTPRTAGYNTLDLSQLSEPSRLLITLLMLVGGSPGSTAGGFKVTTLAVFVLAARAVFRRRADLQCFGRRLPTETLRSAAAVLMMYLGLFLLGGMAICCVEDISLEAALFETASALGTVGLTLGVTPGLGGVSRLILIFLMYFGRVGGLTLIYAVLPGPDYAGALLFFFANGKAARVDLTAYKTTSNRRKLTGAYSDKAPLACIRRLDTDCELAVYSTEPRALIFHTALLAPKTTRTTQGVAVMTLKPKYQLETVKALEDTPITNQSRYRVRSLPAAGALLREEDSEERQMDLLD